tara:strand:+ start:428 stop:577 length:150 start_codon:yes stop_codon:yes gene_type:complete
MAPVKHQPFQAVIAILGVVLKLDDLHHIFVSPAGGQGAKNATGAAKHAG